MDSMYGVIHGNKQRHSVNHLIISLNRPLPCVKWELILVPNHCMEPIVSMTMDDGQEEPAKKRAKIRR